MSTVEPEFNSLVEAIEAYNRTTTDDSGPFSGGSGGKTGSEIMAEGGDPSSVATIDPNASSVQEKVKQDGLRTLSLFQDLAQDGDDNGQVVFDNVNATEQGRKDLQQGVSELGTVLKNVDETTDDDGGGGGGGSGSFQHVQDLNHGWALFTDGSWYVLKVYQNGAVDALTNSLTVESFDKPPKLTSLPSFPTEQKARDAYTGYINDTNKGNDEQDDQSDPGWSQWQKMMRVGNWLLFSRSAKSESKTQYALGGTDDGDSIWLHPGGKVKSEIHAFDSQQAVRTALKKYRKRRQKNPEEVPRPDGGEPTPTPTGGSGGGGGGGSSSSGLTSLASNPVVLVGLAAGGFFVMNSSNGGTQ